MSQLRWLLIAFALATALIVQPTPARTTPASQPISQLRVVHALPGAPPVDVFVDGVRVLPGLAFGVIGPYLNLPAGPHELVVVPAGALAASALITSAWELAPGQPYTVLAVAPPGLPPGAVVLEDTRFATLGGPAKLRFVHASPDMPPVDVLLPGGTVLFSNVAFGQATPYVEVPPGTVTMEVRAAGTPNVVLTIPDAVIATGTVYTFGAIGLMGGTPPLGTLPLVDS
jgi:hypothetical protein